MTTPQAQISSGRVVEITTSVPSSQVHRTSTNFVLREILSTSASAIVVPSTGS